jgi:type I restriction enzyme S subunit
MSWKEITIDQLGKVVTGKTPPTGNSAMYDGQYPFVTPTDLDWQSYLVRATHSTVTDLALASHKNQFLPEKSIAFTCIGNTIGKCGITSEVCLTNQQINSIVPNDNHDPKFIYYLMNFNRARIRSVGLGGGAAQPIINKSTFSAIKVLVPETKSEEERISFVLSTYDDLIENNRRRIELLEEAARLLYREWFLHFRFPGHEHVNIADGVPAGWQRKTLFDCVDILSGGTPKTTEARYWDGEIPFFTPKDAGDGPYTYDTEKMVTEDGLKTCNSKLYPKQTLFVTARGTVGKVRLAQRPMAMNQSCYALQTCTYLTQAYLYFGVTEQVAYMKSRAVGAVFDAIIVDTFKGIPFLLPPEPLANEFSGIATDTLRQIDILSAQNRQLKAARDLLLPRLMDGRLEV